MIYYTTGIKEFTHTTLACFSKGYDLAIFVKPSSFSNAESMLEKWNNRYDLLNTPQQQYRKFLSGQSTFSCIVANGCCFQKENLSEADFYRYLRDKSKSENKLYALSTPTLLLLCRVNDLLLRLPDGEIIQNKYNHLDYLNDQISKQVKGAETFGKISLTMGEYTFLQLTKRAKSIKELQEMGLSENTKHATNFTWRLKQEAFEAVRQRGVNLVNSFQKNKSNTDVKEHFEKYLLSLEGYIGYRGVRVQIGKLYGMFTAYFQSKMNRSFLSAGGRKLNLSYVRASTPKIKNNTEIYTYFRAIKDEANQSSRELLLTWKGTDEGKKFLASKSSDGYVYSDNYYKDIE
ncbi:hypothetical protein [Acinetobacter sp. YH12151]|uniref:hypothetical protein n=1 Tax=Acinetobacter sp. YH12151 TaxID=2601131 RepID=UPI0015D35833|nr:hypothetical protein [Acinetobacter sp. YH12151]